MQKNLFLILWITIFLSPLPAQAGPLTGVFGHDYTNGIGDLVWTVRENTDSFNVKYEGDGSVIAMKDLSSRDLKAFWEKMRWNSSSYINAQCIGNGEVVICYVPLTDRMLEPDLQGMKSDVFHYDPMVGIMEMIRIPNKNDFACPRKCGQ